MINPLLSEYETNEIYEKALLEANKYSERREEIICNMSFVKEVAVNAIQIAVSIERDK